METIQKKEQPGVWTLLRPNLKTLVIFECLYSAIGAMIIIPLMYWLFRGSLNLSGQDYLLPHNVSIFLKSPAFWIAVIIILLIAALYSVISITAVIVSCEYGRQGKKIALMQLIKSAFSNALPVLKPRNIDVILLVLVIIPLMNIGVTPGFLGAITIPDFILEFINYSNVLVWLCGIVCILLIILILRWLYTFNYMVLEKLSFKNACKRSAALGKGKHIKDLLTLVFVQLGLMLIAIVFLAMVAVLFGGCFEIVQKVGGLSGGVISVVMSLAYIFLIIAGVLLLLLGMPVCYSLISANYYAYREAAGSPSPVMDLRTVEQTEKRKRGHIIAVILTLVLIGIMTVIFYVYKTGDINGKVTANAASRIEVIAHRCGAHYAPENTIAALNKAADMGAAGCEIDVQQCKDGSIIVMHDTNFKRTTGKDADSWTLTLDEVKQLDTGSSFSKEFAGEKIPTLDEMIKAAKARNMTLQIEMKPTGNEHDFEKSVADIIEANDFVDQCTIASLDYQCLKNAHEYNPKLKTLYITFLAFGDVMQVEGVTDYSVESTWICNTLAENVHQAGSRLYAWTVNTPSVIQQMIDCNIDGIVTDEVDAAMKVINRPAETNFAEYVIRFFDFSDLTNRGDV